MSTPTKTPRIAILQTGRAPEQLRAAHTDYDAMCKALVGKGPHEADTFAILDGQFPESIDGYDAIIITGSAHGVYEPHPWIPPLMDLIRKAYADGQKMVGICFGHQIIAQALGGVVEKSSKGLGTGVQDYEYRSPDGPWAPISLCAWHQDQIVKLPEGADVIARSPFCEYAGLQYGDQILTFQAHPEFSKDYVEALIKLRRGTTLGTEIADNALTSLAKPIVAPLIADDIRRFITAN